MNTTYSTTINQGILWRQLLSLGTLYASVIIGWIAYYNYQPKLLEVYSFTDLTLFLFIAQGIIMVVTPPIAGKLGDKFRQRAGKRLPVITGGVSFAAMIFMATAFTLLTDPGPVFRWVLPGLITLWLFSMALFTSPALSTIEMFAPGDKLPTAMALITIVYGLLHSIEPVIVEIIDTIGAPATFAVGGIAVFLSGLLLKKNSRDFLDRPNEAETGSSDYTYAFILGIAQGLATTILFNLVPDWLSAKDYAVLGYSGDAVISLVLAGVAILTLPVSRFVRGRPFYVSVLLSILATFAAIFMVFFATDTIFITASLVLFVIFYAMMSVSFLPLSLTIVRDQHKVFGVGIFFAGFELPNGILEAFLVGSGNL